MANIVIAKANALTNGLATVKNGSTGAPSLLQHSDWPMTNLTLPDRYSFWRSPGDDVAQTFDIDFDLGSSQALSYAAITGMRYYGGPTAVDSEVFYATGSTYPPGGWTDSGVAVTSYESDNYAALSITARYLRFEMATPGTPNAFSLKFWAIKTADLLTLAHDWSLETVFSTRRLVRVQEAMGGARHENEMGLTEIDGVMHGGKLVLSGASEAEWISVRDALSAVVGRFLVIDLTNGRCYETALTRGAIRADRRFTGSWALSLDLEGSP